MSRSCANWMNAEQERKRLETEVIDYLGKVVKENPGDMIYQD